MRTQVMHDVESGTCYVEQVRADGSQPQRTNIEAFPFSIGRDASADLQVRSTRVSREHAIILGDGNDFVIRDLGSTNGTFLNGRRIDEAPLNDGDVLLFADAEFTFVSGRGAASRATATQPLGAEAMGVGANEQVLSIIRETRRLHEALTRRAVRCYFQPITRLADGGVSAYAARLQRADLVAGRTTESMMAGVECRLTDRLHHLFRQAAADEAGTLPTGAGVYVDVQPGEIGTESLIDSLGELRARLRGDRPLSVVVPDSAADSGDYFQRMCRCLKEFDVRLVCGFHGGDRCGLLEDEDTLPHGLKFDASLVRQLHRSKQVRIQIETLTRACHKLGVETLADGIRSEAMADACRDVGCDFGMGEWYGTPKPAAQLQSNGV